MQKILIIITMMFMVACSSQPNNEVAYMPELEVSYVVTKTSEIELEQELAGRVKAALVAEVRPQVDGIIHERLFVEGDFVEEGQVLYQLNAETYQAAYNQASASLKSAEVNLASSKQKYDRYNELSKVSGVSKQEREDANFSYQQNLATVAERKAALEAAKINLERASIKAPISGYIGISNYTKGALVNANQATPLAVIRDVDTVYVDIVQSSSSITNLRKFIANNDRIQNASKDVKLIMEDGAEYKYTGKLQVSEAFVDESTGSVTLRAEFPNPDKMLITGMYVRAILVEAVDTDAVLVPLQSVAWNSKNEAYVMLVNENNVIEQRPLIIGQTHGNNWIVIDGLEANEKVVVEGLGKIRSNSKVKSSELVLPQATQVALVK